MSDRFALALGDDASSRAATTLVGVEHEYQVLRGATQLDFRGLVHGLGLGPRHLDPLDLNAYHLPSGAVVSADYREAEIATPPVPFAADGAREVVERARVARHELRALLPPMDDLVGYSTHISVSMDPSLNDGAARLYASTFAPAMIMLLDRRDSPGLLVRPRTDRLELCGEHLEGSRLRAAIAFAVGSAIACAKAIAGERVALPPRIRLRVDPGHERYGWYVDRLACGADLCAGRDVTITLAGGGRVRAQEHLARCVAVAAAEIADARDDLATLYALVRGEIPLPSGSPILADVHDAPAALATHPFALAPRPAERRVFALAPVMVTWRACVFLLVGGKRERRAFVCVTRPALDAFYTLLERGDLDDVLSAYLALPPTGRRLERSEQCDAPGLYDAIGSRRDLIPLERDPDDAPWAEVA